MTVDPCQGRVLISCVRDEREKSMESKYVPVTSSLRKLDDSRHGLRVGRLRGAGDQRGRRALLSRLRLSLSGRQRSGAGGSQRLHRGGIQPGAVLLPARPGVRRDGRYRKPDQRPGKLPEIY